jgi:hypothetical protein
MSSQLDPWFPMWISEDLPDLPDESLMKHYGHLVLKLNAYIALQVLNESRNRPDDTPVRCWKFISEWHHSVWRSLSVAFWQSIETAADCAQHSCTTHPSPIPPSSQPPPGPLEIPPHPLIHSDPPTSELRGSFTSWVRILESLLVTSRLKTRLESHPGWWSSCLRSWSRLGLFLVVA